MKSENKFMVICLIFISTMITLLSIQSVNANVLFETGFETTDTCSASYWIGTGMWTPTLSTDSLEGTYSCGSISSSNNNFRYHDFRNEGLRGEENFNITIYLKRTRSDTEVRVALADENNANYIHLGYRDFESTTKLIYHNGGSWVVTGHNFAIDTWYKIEFRREGNDVKAYFDDNLIVTSTRTGIDMQRYLLTNEKGDGTFDNFTIEQEAPPITDTTNLVAHYTMNNLTDSSGNDETLTITGDTTLGGSSNCRTGDCYYFDDNGDYLTSSLMNDEELGGALSWTGWFKTSSSTNTNGLISVDTGLETGFSSYIINTNVAYLIQGYVSQDHMNTGATTIADNTWTHIAYSVTASGNSYLYVDGVLEDTGSGTFQTKSNKPIDIGTYARLHSFHGYIDEVTFWNKSLNSSEINDIKDYGIVYSSSEPSLPTPDISSIHEDYYNSENVSINIVLDTTKENFNYTDVMGDDIGLTASYYLSRYMTSQTIVDTTNQFCIYKGYDYATSYTEIATGDINYYSHDGDWAGHSGANIPKLDDITCERVTSSVTGNISYSLNGASQIGLCNDCSSDTLDLYNLSDGTQNVTLYVDGTGGTKSNFFNFTIDTIIPTTNITQLEIEQYDFDSNIFSCSDINLDYCNITINNQSYPQGTLINLTSNGNLSYNIYAQDLAGNILNSSSYLYVNPLQYIRINDTLRDIYVHNYTINNTYVNGSYYIFNLFDYGYGTHDINFTKAGYPQEQFNFTLNTSSSLNESYNITPVQVFIKSYNAIGFTPLTNWDLYIYNSSNGLLFNDTISTDYEAYYNESYPDLLTYVIAKDGFTSSYVEVEVNPYSSIDKDIYLLSNTSFLLPITIMNVQQTKLISGVSVTLWAEVNGQDYFISERVTDSTGRVYVNLVGDFLYKVILTKDNYIEAEYYVSPYESSYTFLLSAEVNPLEYLFADFSYKFEQHFSNNSKYFTLKYYDEAEKINNVEFVVTGTNFSYTDTSTDNLQDTLDISVPLTNGSKAYTLTFNFKRAGIDYSYSKTFYDYDEVYDGTFQTTLDELLNEEEEDELTKYFFVTIIMICLAIFGAMVGGFLGLGFSVIAGLIYFYEVNILSGFIAIPLTLLILLVLAIRGGD